VYLTKVDRTALAIEVYQRLRDAIFDGELPSGARLDVQKIAKTLEVSNQPVKEALNRLALEGLVLIKPRSGTHVRTVSPDDIDHLLTARLMLETFAVKRIRDLSPTDLEALGAWVRRLEHLAEERPFPFMAYNEADVAFHESLIGLSRNPVLLRLYRSLHAHYVTARGYYQTANEKTIANEADHRKIFEAVRAHRFKDAERIVTTHILAAKAALMPFQEDLG